MTTDRSGNDDGNGSDIASLLPPLDHGAGPATPISDAFAAQLAQQVVARALLTQAEASDAVQSGPALALSDAQARQLATRVTRRFRGRHGRHVLWQVAAACLLAMAFGSGAWAAVRVWLDPQYFTSTPRHDDSAARAPKSPPATPAAPIAPAPVTHEPATPQAAPVVAAPIVAEPTSLSAEQLLERANAARARREWAQAERLYARVVQADKGNGVLLSDTAYAATVAAAALQLEHTHDARGALERYRFALNARPHGSLSEEARYGMANAHKALGAFDAEQAALRQFLAHHPRSLFAPHAQKRLQELTRTP